MIIYFNCNVQSTNVFDMAREDRKCVKCPLTPSDLIHPCFAHCGRRREHIDKLEFTAIYSIQQVIFASYLPVKHPSGDYHRYTFYP